MRHYPSNINARIGRNQYAAQNSQFIGGCSKEGNRGYMDDRAGVSGPSFFLARYDTLDNYYCIDSPEELHMLSRYKVCSVLCLDSRYATR